MHPLIYAPSATMWTCCECKPRTPRLSKQGVDLFGEFTLARRFSGGNRLGKVEPQGWNGSPIMEAEGRRFDAKTAVRCCV